MVTEVKLFAGIVTVEVSVSVVVSVVAFAVTVLYTVVVVVPGGGQYLEQTFSFPRSTTILMREVQLTPQQ